MFVGFVRRAAAAVLLAAGGVGAAAAPSGPDSGKVPPVPEEVEVTVAGRAVCLREGQPVPVEGCSFGEAFGIEAADGTVHPLDPSDPRVEILTDPRVNRHPLEVTLWREEGLGKIIHLHTIQNGQAIEPYYFCFTCNITSHLPGPCWCCQQEFEFKERPVPKPTGG